MECIQAAARTANLSLDVASRAQAFPRRLTNSGSILTRASHLDGGVIGNHQFITSHTGSAPASSYRRPTPLALSHMHPIPSIPAQTHPSIAMTNYTHAPTVTNSSNFHVQLHRSSRSSSGVSDNSSTTTTNTTGEGRRSGKNSKYFFALYHWSILQLLRCLNIFFLFLANTTYFANINQLYIYISVYNQYCKFN